MRLLTAQLRVVGNKGDDGLLGLLSINVMLHIHSLQLVLGRELLDLAIGDGAHQGGFAAAVGPAQPVALATLQVEHSVVQQDLGTCIVDSRVRFGCASEEGLDLAEKLL